MIFAEGAFLRFLSSALPPNLFFKAGVVFDFFLRLILLYYFRRRRLLFERCHDNEFEHAPQRTSAEHITGHAQPAADFHIRGQQHYKSANANEQSPRDPQRKSFVHGVTLPLDFTSRLSPRGGVNRFTARFNPG